MNYEILEERLSFHLHGKFSQGPVTECGPVGISLMNEMWSTLRSVQAPNAGLNHWVYLRSGQMFVGVELLPDATPPEGLDGLEFELVRYLRHTHVGPYHHLPAKWQALKEELTRLGHTLDTPSLEIYGHHVADPEQLQTTILIAIK